jgi:tripartite-type tricarboxylate transporter receptor subunit TctC
MKRGAKMRKKIFCYFVCVVMFCLFLSPGGLLAAPYYEGKKIKMIVGFGAGMGYDRMSRLIAKHLPKHIPGKPVILVENMPGASSMIAANRVYSLEKPDGLTIGNINRGLPFAQLTKVEGARFDLLKYSWIGSMAIETTVLAIRADLPYKTFEELRKSKVLIHMGDMGSGGSVTQFTILARDFLGLNIKTVTYPASPDVMLALERKEIDGRAGTYSSFKPFVERGLLRLVLRGRVSEPGIENLPVNEDLTADKTGKTLMAMLSVVDKIGRPYVAPPGTPPEIINILRQGFAGVAKDPEAKEEAKKMMMEVEYVPAGECMNVLNYLFNQPEDIVKEFSRYAKF